jgi:hypothetical protein
MQFGPSEVRRTFEGVSRELILEHLLKRRAARAEAEADLDAIAAVLRNLGELPSSPPPSITTAWTLCCAD